MHSKCGQNVDFLWISRCCCVVEAGGTRCGFWGGGLWGKEFKPRLDLMHRGEERQGDIKNMSKRKN